MPQATASRAARTIFSSCDRADRRPSRPPARASDARRRLRPPLDRRRSRRPRPRQHDESSDGRGGEVRRPHARSARWSAAADAGRGGAGASRRRPVVDSSRVCSSARSAAVSASGPRPPRPSPHDAVGSSSASASRRPSPGGWRVARGQPRHQRRQRRGWRARRRSRRAAPRARRGRSAPSRARLRPPPARCSAACPAPGPSSSGRRLLVRAGDAEVGQPRRAVGAQQDVRGLDVAVEDPGARGCAPGRPAARCATAIASSGCAARLAQRPAGHVLHDQERPLGRRPRSRTPSRGWDG